MFRYMITAFIILFFTASIFFLISRNPPEGKKLYVEYCATCHGSDLSGGNASSLTDGKWQFGSEELQIRRNIKNGIEDYGMPAFSESLNDDKIIQIIEYLSAEAMASGSGKTIITETLTTQEYTIALEDWIDNLEIPWSIEFLDAQTALVTERPGRLRMIRNGVLLETPVSGTPVVLHKGQGGLLDVAKDPEYEQNGWIYLAYSHSLAGEEKDAPAMTRIVRGHLVNNTWTDEQTLFEANHEHYLTTRYHYGSRIVFDQKGYLYFSIGDRGRQDQSQDITRPNGKIHRIHNDGRIPGDNPFSHDKHAVPSIFTYGNRNPQGLAVHPLTDQVWATEHGPLGGDELNLLKSGANYGWPVITYGKNYDGTIISDLTKKEGMEIPILYWRPSIAVCGLDFYRGSQFPRWNNDLLVGALKYEEVRIVDVEENRVVHEEVILKNYGRVRDVVCGPDGAIYVVLNEPDKILRLTRYEEK